MPQDAGDDRYERPPRERPYPNCSFSPSTLSLGTGVRSLLLLLSGRHAAEDVVALTDVYTGTKEFKDAQDAKDKMRRWVGEESRFYAHAAQHDFEAWLLPFWTDIQRLAGSTAPKPSPHPEQVNHGRPPAYRLTESVRELRFYRGRV